VYRANLRAPQVILFYFIIEIDRPPVWHISDRPKVLERIINKVITFARIKFFIKIHIWFKIGDARVFSGASNCELVADSQGRSMNPCEGRIGKERHIPSIQNHVINNLGVVLKLGRLKDFG